MYDLPVGEIKFKSALGPLRSSTTHFSQLEKFSFGVLLDPQEADHVLMYYTQRYNHQITLSSEI